MLYCWTPLVIARYSRHTQAVKLTQEQRERLAAAVRAERGSRKQEQIVALAPSGGLSRPVLSQIENAHNSTYKPRTFIALREALGWTEAQLAEVLGQPPVSSPSVAQTAELELADRVARLEEGLQRALDGAAVRADQVSQFAVNQAAWAVRVVAVEKAVAQLLLQAPHVSDELDRPDDQASDG